jgi:hypothetical protein
MRTKALKYGLFCGPHSIPIPAHSRATIQGTFMWRRTRGLLQRRQVRGHGDADGRTVRTCQCRCGR